MSDDKTNAGAQDRSRVNMNEDYEVQYWSTKFGVTAEALRAAVDAVGTSAAEVERYLSQAR